jgi:hypothetical protein
MIRKRWLWCIPVLAAVGLGVGADRLLSAGADAKQDLRPATTLPITQVVLFNSGVGYFARSGEVEGDARVDLTFPEEDVNDLLKSMVLQDLDGGRVAAVSYDSREPIARTLASFAIDLNGNPSFAQIALQARGERVEVTVSPTAANQPGKLVGAIIGVEKQKVPAGNNAVIDVDVLNLWCAEGLRSVRLTDVQQLRFSNPVVESELRRALDVLALSHDTQRKAVSLHFAGDGRRRVKVGYVIEAPIWKTSYRLVLDAAGKEKPYLQGWAAVENPTDEDWAGVRMALVSGRPISFKMDLYNPLYVPRPVVEPELFASLRPPTYSGGFRGLADRAGEAAEPAAPPRPKAGFGKGGAKVDPSAARGGIAGPSGPGGFGGAPGGAPVPGLAAGGRMQLAEGADAATEAERRRYAAELGRDLASKMNLGAVGSAATAGALGDFFQYVVDHPISLARQKSALLPIVGKEVEGTRVSIYNPAVQPKHPLLGLRFKNTTGLHLSQGPITVFEGSTYAGDTRVLDVQPGEERLVSYAIDLGTEVITQPGPGSSRITSVRAVKGVVTTVTKVREERTYKIANRSEQDRTLLIEHPNRTNQQFKLVETAKPVEETAEVYRFKTEVKAGAEATFKVAEERDISASVALSNSPDEQIRYFMSLTEATPALKQKLAEALKLKGTWDAHKRDLAQVQADLNRLSGDQDRIRKNLRETPREAEVYQTYLKKLSEQEKEIDDLTARQKKLMGAEFEARKAFENYLVNLTTE